MKLTILSFASIKEIVGSGTIELDMKDGAIISDLYEKLSADYPEVARFGNSLKFAVNEEFVDSDKTLNEGDEVALLPPVSGG